MANTRSPFLALLVFFSSTLVSAAEFSISEAEATELTASLKAKKYGAVSSLLIASGEDVVFEYYADGINKDSLHNTRSVGKTVTAYLAGVAIAQKKIPSANALVAPYFKELLPFENPDPRKQAITLESLMNMSNPLECNDWNSYSRGNEERMYLVEDWSAFFLNLPIRARPSWEVSDQPKFANAFSYCTAGAQMVGEIVQRASEKDIAEYSNQYLFKPMGISSAKWNRASTGVAHMGGGLEMNSRDWLRIGQLVAARGTLNGKQVLSKEWVDEMLTPRSQIEDGMHYGYFFWLPEKFVNDKKIKIGMMSGTGGNRIYALPDHNISVVITKNAFRDRDAHQTSDTLFDERILQRLSLIGAD